MAVVLLVYIIRRARIEFNKTVDELDKDNVDRMENGHLVRHSSDSSSGEDVCYDRSGEKPLL